MYSCASCGLCTATAASRFAVAGHLARQTSHSYLTVGTQGSGAERVGVGMTPDSSGDWLINCEDYYFHWRSAAIPYSELTVTVSTGSATDVQFEVYIDLYGESARFACCPAHSPPTFARGTFTLGSPAAR